MAIVHSVEIDAEAAGVVNRGYDPVVYLTESHPTPGHFDLSVTYDGETYFFATASSRDAFEANPRRYVARYGGCRAHGGEAIRKLASAHHRDAV